MQIIAERVICTIPMVMCTVKVILSRICVGVFKRSLVIQSKIEYRHKVVPTLEIINHEMFSKSKLYLIGRILCLDAKFRNTSGHRNDRTTQRQLIGCNIAHVQPVPTSAQHSSMSNRILPRLMTSSSM